MVIGFSPSGSVLERRVPSPCNWPTGPSPAPSPTTSWWPSWGEWGGTLERVIISRVEENTYFAELIIHRGEEIISVDARPSDSIAMALRVKAKIFADDNLLEDVSVEIADEESVSLDLDSGEPLDPETKTETLKEYLRKLNPEDFGRFAP